MHREDSSTGTPEPTRRSRRTEAERAARLLLKASQLRDKRLGEGWFNLRRSGSRLLLFPRLKYKLISLQIKKQVSIKSYSQILDVILPYFNVAVLHLKKQTRARINRASQSDLVRIYIDGNRGKGVKLLQADGDRERQLRQEELSGTEEVS